jgi:hypothetical protein
LYDTESDGGDDDNDGGDDGHAQPLPGLNAGVDDPASDNGDSNASEYDQDQDDGGDNSNNENNANEENVNDDEEHIPEINVPDVMLSTPTPEVRENAGVGIALENTGVPDGNTRKITGVQGPHTMPTMVGNRFFHDMTREHKRMNEQIMNERYGPRAHHFNLQEWT